MQDKRGHGYPIKVVARSQKGEEAVPTTHDQTRDSVVPLSSAASDLASFPPTRRDSDAELEKGLVARKKRKLDEGEDSSHKRPRVEDE